MTFDIGDIDVDIQAFKAAFIRRIDHVKICQAFTEDDDTYVQEFPSLNAGNHPDDRIFIYVLVLYH
jgi:hypothetical protein